MTSRMRRTCRGWWKRTWISCVPGCDALHSVPRPVTSACSNGCSLSSDDASMRATAPRCSHSTSFMFSNIPVWTARRQQRMTAWRCPGTRAGSRKADPRARADLEARRLRDNVFNLEPRVRRAFVRLRATWDGFLNCRLGSISTARDAARAPPWSPMSGTRRRAVFVQAASTCGKRS